MCQLLERQFVLSQSVATAAFDAERRILDVEYFNGLVFRYFDISPEIGRALFQENSFDKVFRTRVAKLHDYKLVEKLLPVYLG